MRWVLRAENEEVLVWPNFKALSITALLKSQKENQVQVHQEHEVLQTNTLWLKDVLNHRWLRESPKKNFGWKQHPEWSNSHNIRNPSRDSVTQSAWLDITAVLGTQKKYSWACVLVRTGGTYSHKIMQPTDSQTFSLPSPVLHGSLLTVLWFLITHLRVKAYGISVAESLLIPTKKTWTARNKRFSLQWTRWATSLKTISKWNCSLICRRVVLTNRW